MSDFQWIDEADYHLVDDPEQYDEILDQLESVEKMAFDIETDSLNSFTGIIAGVSISTEAEQGWYFPFNHLVGDNLPPDSILKLKKVLDDPLKTILMYNAKFDRGFMNQYGFTIPGYEDVMVSTYLDDPNENNNGLKNCGKKYLGLETMEITQFFKKKADINFAKLNPKACYHYACQDTDLTFRLHEHLYDIRHKYKFIWDLENRLIDVVQRIEMTGVVVNKERVDLVAGELQKQKDALQAEFEKVVGPGVNIDSPTQIGKRLFASQADGGMGIENPYKTATGKPKTDDKTLKALASSHPIIAKIGEYRGISKALGSYVQPLQENCPTGLAHFSFLSLRVPTGRFAASGGGPGSHYCGINIQCLDVNEKVWTRNGVEKIGELPENGSIWTGSHWSKYEGPWFDEKEVYGYNTAGAGRIVCSEDHLLLTQEGFKRAGDLVPDADYIAANKKVIEYPEENYSFDFLGRTIGPGRQPAPYCYSGNHTELWEVLGHFVGDGCFSEDRGFVVAFGHHETGIKKHFQQNLDALGISHCEKQQIKKGYENPVFHVYSRKRAHYEFLKQFGSGRGAHNKKVPECLFKDHPDSKVAFLRGLFTADGGLNSSVRLRTVSEDLALGVKHLLASLGFQASVKKDKYGYHVTPWDIIRFRDEVGFYGEKEHILDHYEDNPGVTKKARFEPEGAEPGYLWSLFKGKEFLGKRKVCDIHVPGDEQFVLASGAVVHNSFPKNSDAVPVPCRRITNRPDTVNDDDFWPDDQQVIEPKHLLAKIQKSPKIYEEDTEELNTIGQAITATPLIHHLGETYCLLEDSPGLHIEEVESEPSLLDLSELNGNYNLRAFFKARPGYKIVDIDYANQELRVAACFSQEPVFLDAFLHNRDLHWEMAKRAFKLPDNAPIDGKKRKIAKILNFALLYGASAHSLAGQANITKREAEIIYDDYFAAVPKLKAWMDYQHAFVMANHGVQTYFRRWRPLDQWTKSTDRKDHGYANSSIRALHSVSVPVMRTSYSSSCQ